MDTKIITFGVLFSFVIGFYFGSVADFNIQEEHDIAPKIASLDKSFKQIARKEISTWESIEDPERKKARALEILGQTTRATIETLDLGVNITEWGALWGEVIRHSPTPLPTLDMANVTNSPSNLNDAINAIEKIARTMKKTDLFNEDGTLRDPGRFLSESKPVASHSNVFDRLQGTSKGEIQLNARGDKTYYLSIRSDFVYDGKEFKGSAGVELSDESRGIFSTSTSEDASSYFFTHPEDDSGIIVMTSKSSFVYLSLNQVRGVFSGHYFERDLRSKSYRLKGRLPRLARTAY